MWFDDFNNLEIACAIVNSLVEYGMNEHLESNGVYDWFFDNNLFDCGFWTNNGATKTCFGHDDLPGWVFKVGHTRGVKRGCNYARLEYDNYCKAIDCGLERYFPETHFIGEFGGQEYFVQFAADCDEERVTSDWFERLSDSYLDNGEEVDSDRIWNEIDDLDSEDKARLVFGDEELCDFLSENRINDLHEGNFGYIKGCMVIIDFSGYAG